ncbi:hypothetical protein Slin14017_G122430 [Septoria linicola]|nr:hypothetical protein Slin14017_G122430 [Septoria linicola]
MATIDERYLAETIERDADTSVTSSWVSGRSSVSVGTDIRSSPSMLEDDEAELSEVDEEDDVGKPAQMGVLSLERSFEVDQILGRKFEDSIVLYKVKWRPSIVRNDRIRQNDDESWVVDIDGGRWDDVSEVNIVNSFEREVVWKDSWRPVWMLGGAMEAIAAWHIRNPDQEIILDFRTPAFWKLHKPEAPLLPLEYQMPADTDVFMGPRSEYFQPKDIDHTMPLLRYSRRRAKEKPLTPDALALLNRPVRRPLIFSKQFIEAGKAIQIGRPTTFMALLAYCVGQAIPDPCSSCTNGKSPVPKCVSVDSHFRGACVGCAILGNVSSCESHLSHREYERGDRLETYDSHGGGLRASQQAAALRDDLYLDDFINDVLQRDFGTASPPAPAQQCSLSPGLDNNATASPVQHDPSNQQSNGDMRRASNTDLRASVTPTDDSLYCATPKRHTTDPLADVRKDLELQTAQQQSKRPSEAFKSYASKGFEEERKDWPRTETPAMTLAFRPGPSSSSPLVQASDKKPCPSPGESSVSSMTSSRSSKREQVHSPEAESSADEKPSFKRWRRNKHREQSKNKRARTQSQQEIKPEPEARFRSAHPNCQPLQRCRDPLMGQPAYANGPILVFNDQAFAKDEASPEEVRYVISQCNCDNAETLFNLAKDSFDLRFANGDGAELSEYTWEGELAGRFWQQLNSAIVMCPPRGRKKKMKGRSKQVVDLTLE